MIITSTAEVWQGTDCNWVWFKRDGKTPLRCPNTKCRKRSMPEALARIVEEKAATHDPKSCRVYRCAQCIALGKHF